MMIAPFTEPSKTKLIIAILSTSGDGFTATKSSSASA